MGLIVLPGLIDHQYAKFAASYGILVDSAILKSMIFADFVNFAILWMDGRENLETRTDKRYFGKCADGQAKLFFWCPIGQTLNE